MVCVHSRTHMHPPTQTRPSAPPRGPPTSAVSHVASPTVAVVAKKITHTLHTARCVADGAPLRLAILAKPREFALEPNLGRSDNVEVQGTFRSVLSIWIGIKNQYKPSKLHPTRYRRI